MIKNENLKDSYYFINYFRKKLLNSDIKIKTPNKHLTILFKKNIRNKNALL